MAVKTWTSERVTSADINTYLTNSGLVYVKSQTVGTGVTSVTVPNCFSSTYDDYRVIYSGGVSSATAGIGVQLGPSSISGYNTNYGHVLHWTTVGVAAVDCDTTGAAAYCYYLGGATTSNTFLMVDIVGPYLAKQTGFLNGTYLASDWGQCRGRHANTTSFTDVTLINMTSGATFTGGNIIIYGYRKP